MGTKISRDQRHRRAQQPADLQLWRKGSRQRTIRNDGTYIGKEIGEILCKKGDEGFVVSIGTFLQQFYIYGVEFTETGNRVGMKRKELDPDR